MSNSTLRVKRRALKAAAKVSPAPKKVAPKQPTKEKPSPRKKNKK